MTTLPSPNPPNQVYAPQQQMSTVGAGAKQVKTAPAGATVDVFVNCALGGFHEVILLGAASTTTLYFINPQPGQRLVLVLTQSASGSDLVTWINTYFAGGTEPTLTTTASAHDAFELIYDDVALIWIARTIALDYKA